MFKLELNTRELQETVKLLSAYRRMVKGGKYTKQPYACFDFQQGELSITGFSPSNVLYSCTIEAKLNGTFIPFNMEIQALDALAKIKTKEPFSYLETKESDVSRKDSRVDFYIGKSKFSLYTVESLEVERQSQDDLDFEILSMPDFSTCLSKAKSFSDKPDYNARMQNVSIQGGSLMASNGHKLMAIANAASNCPESVEIPGDIAEFVAKHSESAKYPVSIGFSKQGSVSLAWECDNIQQLLNLTVEANKVEHGSMQTISETKFHPVIFDLNELLTFAKLPKPSACLSLHIGQARAVFECLGAEYEYKDVRMFDLFFECECCAEKEFDFNLNPDFLDEIIQRHKKDGDLILGISDQDESGRRMIQDISGDASYIYCCLRDKEVKTESESESEEKAA